MRPDPAGPPNRQAPVVGVGRCHKIGQGRCRVGGQGPDAPRPGAPRPTRRRAAGWGVRENCRPPGRRRSGCGGTPAARRGLRARLSPMASGAPQPIPPDLVVEMPHEPAHDHPGRLDAVFGPGVGHHDAEGRNGAPAHHRLRVSLIKRDQWIDGPFGRDPGHGRARAAPRAAPRAGSGSRSRLRRRKRPPVSEGDQFTTGPAQVGRPWTDDRSFRREGQVPFRAAQVRSIGPCPPARLQFHLARPWRSGPCS